MNKWKNLGLILISILTLAVAVGGMFLLRQTFDRKKEPASSPEPVEVETVTEEAGTEQPEPEEPSPEQPALPATESPEGKDLEEKVNRVLASLSLQEKIGQMFLVDFSQLGGSSNTFINDRTRSRLAVYPVGGVLFQKSNVASADQVSGFIRDLQSSAKLPMFIAVEEEGGKNSTLASNPNVEMPVLSAPAEYTDGKDPQAAGTDAANTGRVLKELGFNMNLAPMADVEILQEEPVLEDRSFGSDAMVVRQMAQAQIAGYQGAGISSVMKYFPGIGGAAQSTSEGYAQTGRSKEEMRAREWLPYMAGISAGIDGIMMANISAPSLTDGERTPSTLSSKVVTRVLRQELGYNGMILSAPLNEQAVTRYYSSSEAVLKAVDAGVDVVFLPGSLDGTYAALESAVKNGTVSMDRIDQSVKRILAVKIVRGLIDPEDYPAPTPSPSEEEGEESGRSREDAGEDSDGDEDEDPDGQSDRDSGDDSADEDENGADAE